jgi:hypothetical protein
MEPYNVAEGNLKLFICNPLDEVVRLPLLPLLIALYSNKSRKPYSYKEEDANRISILIAFSLN